MPNEMTIEQKIERAAKCSWRGDPSDPMLRALIEAPCTREAIDHVLQEHRGITGGPRYPDEWYADKDNFYMGRPTGHPRYEGGKVVWVQYQNPRKEFTND